MSWSQFHKLKLFARNIHAVATRDFWCLIMITNLSLCLHGDKITFCLCRNRLTPRRAQSMQGGKLFRSESFFSHQCCSEDDNGSTKSVIGIQLLATCAWSRCHKWHSLALISPWSCWILLHGNHEYAWTALTFKCLSINAFTSKSSSSSPNGLISDSPT